MESGRFPLIEAGRVIRSYYTGIIHSAGIRYYP